MNVCTAYMLCMHRCFRSRLFTFRLFFSLFLSFFFIERDLSFFLLFFLNFFSHSFFPPFSLTHTLFRFLVSFAIFPWLFNQLQFNHNSDLIEIYLNWTTSYGCFAYHLPVCAYETGTFQMDICDVTDAKNFPNANGMISRM